MLSWFRLQHARIVTLNAYRRGDWRAIPIKECGEPLVEVPPECSHPFYCKEMKLTDDSRILVRKEVLARFMRARAILESEGYELTAYDGWRSVELQESLFWFYMREFTAARFGVQERFSALSTTSEIRDCFRNLPETLQATMRDANRTYVSWPSRDPSAPSPHASGGAIDVWLHKEGKPVNLGVPFDWMHEDAGAFYHLKFMRRRFHGNDRAICKNRSHLLLAMIDAGFSCYGPEIWHFNFGNQMDALVKGGKARYSYIEPA